MSEGRIGERSDRVHWSTVAVIAGIIVPLVIAAVGWGMLFERVDNQTQQGTALSKQVDQQGILLTQLNITIVRLSTSVDMLTQQLKRDEDMHAEPARR